MAINITDKKKCSGCSACSVGCPQKCISLEEDSTGFLYPRVDADRCVDCGICERICPILNDGIEDKAPIAVYAAWSRDDSLRMSSTSGGIFSELAKYVLSVGGCVVGAAYGENNVIVHQMVYEPSGVEKLKQSKYAQSKMGSIYENVKQELQNRTVLFCGSPCQVAGLKSYLRKDYANLICIDFICRGVNSPKAYKYWLEEIEQRHHSRVNRVWFKYKEDGWKKSPRCTRIDLDNGESLVQKGEKNTFMCGYLGPNLYIRPSCSECGFKGRHRASDITVGDFWGVDASLDNDRGTSMVQINTEAGKRLFESIQDRVDRHACPPEMVASGNVCMENSVPINPRSQAFLEELGTGVPFSKLVAKYAPVKPVIRAKRFFKRLLRTISGK